MAGGVGSRLWPLSRSAFPKQYQALVGPGEEGMVSTMLQQTFLRLDGLKLGLKNTIGYFDDLIKKERA